MNASNLQTIRNFQHQLETLEIRAKELRTELTKINEKRMCFQAAIRNHGGSEESEIEKAYANGTACWRHI